MIFIFMKLTVKQLKQLIKEEISNRLQNPSNMENVVQTKVQVKVDELRALVKQQLNEAYKPSKDDSIADRVGEWSPEIIPFIHDLQNEIINLQIELDDKVHNTNIPGYKRLQKLMIELHDHINHILSRYN